MKLHLGCGQNIIPGWMNIDLEPGPGGVRHDLRKRLPFGDGSARFIFNEHFLEHITPDLKKLLDDYDECALVNIPGIWEPKTLCQMVNEGLRLWGHQYVYDRPDLHISLIESGFKGSSINSVVTRLLASTARLPPRSCSHAAILALPCSTSVSRL